MLVVPMLIDIHKCRQERISAAKWHKERVTNGSNCCRIPNSGLTKYGYSV